MTDIDNFELIWTGIALLVAVAAGSFAYTVVIF